MGFKFAQTTKEVEIENKKYTIKIGDLDLIEKLSSVYNESEPIITKDDPTGYRAMMEKNRAQIDAILGPGASKEIFKGRPLNLVDHASLIAFITREITSLSELHNREVIGNTLPPVITNVINANDDTIQ
jgi:hypothetical protein